MTNHSNEETTFSFPSTAHFKMFPPKGLLMAQQILPVIISFQPNQLGSFKSNADINILENLLLVNIKVFGDSVPADGPKILYGGADKNFIDFEKKLKFIDSINNIDEEEKLNENFIFHFEKMNKSVRLKLHEKEFRNSMTLMSLNKEFSYGTTKYR